MRIIIMCPMDTVKFSFQTQSQWWATKEVLDGKVGVTAATAKRKGEALSVRRVVTLFSTKHGGPSKVRILCSMPWHTFSNLGFFHILFSRLPYLFLPDESVASPNSDTKLPSRSEWFKFDVPGTSNKIPHFKRGQLSFLMIWLWNKLAKLGDAIAISNLKLSITDSLTGVGARRCYCIKKYIWSYHS